MLIGFLIAFLRPATQKGHYGWEDKFLTKALRRSRTCSARSASKGSSGSPTIYFRAAQQSAWEEQPIPVQNGCPVSMIRFLDSLKGVAIAGTTIFFSEDGGKHWRQSVIRPSAKIRTPVNLQFRGHEGWIGCDYGEILHTADDGRHWEEIVKPGGIWSKARGFGSWGAVHFINATTGFTLGGAGEVFETRDRGKTWSKIVVPEGITHMACAEDKCWLTSNDRLYQMQGE